MSDTAQPSQLLMCHCVPPQVNLIALQSLQQIVPLLGDALNPVTAALVPALATCLASSNVQARAAVASGVPPSLALSPGQTTPDLIALITTHHAGACDS